VGVEAGKAVGAKAEVGMEMVVVGREKAMSELRNKCRQR